MNYETYKSGKIISLERNRVPEGLQTTSRDGGTHIAGVLQEIFRGIDSPEGRLKDVLRERWDELAGPVAAKHTRPGRLSRGVFVVFVKNSVWLNELSRTELRGISRRIQEEFGANVISRVIMKVG